VTVYIACIHPSLVLAIMKTEKLETGQKGIVEPNVLVACSLFVCLATRDGGCKLKLKKIENLKVNLVCMCVWLVSAIRS
jgi:hypothetical protein